MVRSLAVHASRQEAESVRRRLAAEGVLRRDLLVDADDDGVWFPATEGDTEHDFCARPERPRTYTELLAWPDDLLAVAPRAFDALGELVLVKVPDVLWPRRAELGEALRRFHAARAVFHDHGVSGPFRVRNLERIAGEGSTATTVQENGVRLHIDPGAAYYSPRLAHERARITDLVRRGERVIDLFGGVAPQGVQCAKQGADVVSVDLNPAAVELARRNAAANHVDLEVHVGDARAVAKSLAPADRVIMNLPHGAKAFVDVGVSLLRRAGVLHHHEIVARDAVAERAERLTAEVADLGRKATAIERREVRAYSAKEAHMVFDVEVR